MRRSAAFYVHSFCFVALVGCAGNVSNDESLDADKPSFDASSEVSQEPDASPQPGRSPEPAPDVPGIAIKYRTLDGHHFVTVDLRDPTISLRATTHDERRRTTSSFANLVGARVAINGDYFSYADYSTRGLAIGAGQIWPGSVDLFDHGFIACTAENDCTVDTSGTVVPTNPSWTTGVGGNGAFLIRNGQVNSFPNRNSAEQNEYHEVRQHSAMGLSGDRRTLFMVSSSATNYPKLAALLAEQGAHWAIKLDGGGSADIVIDGSSKVGSTRRVANHFAVLHKAAPKAPGCGILGAGQALSRGETLHSCQNRYRLSHQGDGNVVVYNQTTGKAVWATHTYGRTTTTFAMQGDGNLVLYNGRSALWNAGTWGEPGAFSAMQDDGNLVVYRADGTPAWSSNSAGQ